MLDTPNTPSEYEIILCRLNYGGLTLDLNVPGNTGSSYFAEFRSAEDLREFLVDCGLHEERIHEIESMWQGLHKGQAFHAQMFLPATVEERLRSVAA